MKRYDTYKPSGIDWLGEIPEHWEVKRVKDVAVGITGFAFNSSKFTDSGIKLVRGINVKESVLNWNDTSYWPNISPELKRFLLKADDVLVQMDGSKVGKNFCIVKDEDLPLILVQRVTRLRSHITFNSKFLFYLIASNRFYDWISIKKTDPMVPHITLKDIEEFVVLITTNSEQTTIATYLDTKTAAIDRKIELLTAKANKYKALRRSLINETVCRGLNPNAPLKDSGIEWIGMIPEHWEVKRVKDIAFLNLKTLPENTPADYSFKYIDIGSVNQNGIKEEPVLTSFEEAPSRARRIVLQNDVIISTVRTYLKAIAFFNYIPKDYIVSTGFAVLSPKRNIYPQYLAYHSQTDMFIDIVFINSTGVSYPAINAQLLSDFIVLFPSYQEQVDIADYLNTKTAQIDTILTNISEQIGKLTQLRKTLINDVATGKIKVTE